MDQSSTHQVLLTHKKHHHTVSGEGVGLEFHTVINSRRDRFIRRKGYIAVGTITQHLESVGTAGRRISDDRPVVGITGSLEFSVGNLSRLRQNTRRKATVKVLLEDDCFILIVVLLICDDKALGDGVGTFGGGFSWRFGFGDNGGGYIGTGGRAGGIFLPC